MVLGYNSCCVGIRHRIRHVDQRFFSIEARVFRILEDLGSRNREDDPDANERHRKIVQN